MILQVGLAPDFSLGAHLTDFKKSIMLLMCTLKTRDQFGVSLAQLMCQIIGKVVNCDPH